VLTLLWIPDAQKQAGTLYPLGPLGHCTHRATVGTGPQWALYPSSGLQRTGAQAGWATPVQLSHRTATACTPLPPCAGLGTGLDPGSPYKHDLKGERWVSGGAGGRREERG